MAMSKGDAAEGTLAVLCEATPEGRVVAANDTRLFV